MQSKGKRVLIAGIAGTAVFGAVVASAATLGGLTSDTLSANTAVVASCHAGPGVLVKWGGSTYAGTGPQYGAGTGTTAVQVTGLTGCEGQNIKVSLTDSTGTLLGNEATGTVTGGATFSGVVTGANNKLVEGVAVVVYPV